MIRFISTESSGRAWAGPTTFIGGFPTRNSTVYNSFIAGSWQAAFGREPHGPVKPAIL
jgi:hypothetical protein